MLLYGLCVPPARFYRFGTAGASLAQALFANLGGPIEQDRMSVIGVLSKVLHHFVSWWLLFVFVFCCCCCLFVFILDLRYRASKTGSSQYKDDDLKGRV